MEAFADGSHCPVEGLDGAVDIIIYLSSIILSYSLVVASEC